MTLITEHFVECDGCRTRVLGEHWPDSWRAVSQAGEDVHHYCTLVCVGTLYAPPRQVVEARATALRLSASEFAVLEQLAAGLQNDEIAIRLECSRNTVKNNLSQVYRHLGAEDRLQAVLIANYLKLVDVEPLGVRLWQRRRRPDG